MFRTGRRAVAADLSVLEAGPPDERHGTAPGVAWVWFAANLGLPGWYLGVLVLAMGLHTAQALAAIVVGNVVGSAALGALSTLGPASALPRSRCPAASSAPAAMRWRHP